VSDERLNDSQVAEQILRLSEAFHPSGVTGHDALEWICRQMLGALAHLNRRVIELQENIDRLERRSGL
jgi:hypothetical protein